MFEKVEEITNYHAIFDSQFYLTITMPADEVIDENESSVVPVPFIDTVEYVDKCLACMNSGVHT